MSAASVAVDISAFARAQSATLSFNALDEGPKYAKMQCLVLISSLSRSIFTAALAESHAASHPPGPSIPHVLGGLEANIDGEKPALCTS